MTEPIAGSLTEENCWSKSATSSSASSDPDEKSFSDEGILRLIIRGILRKRTTFEGEISRESYCSHQGREPKCAVCEVAMFIDMDFP